MAFILRFTIIVEAWKNCIPDTIAETARPIIPTGYRFGAFEFVTCVALNLSIRYFSFFFLHI
jgi:hypothetical protein